MRGLTEGRQSQGMTSHNVRRPETDFEEVSFLLTSEALTRQALKGKPGVELET